MPWDCLVYESCYEYLMVFECVNCLYMTGEGSEPYSFYGNITLFMFSFVIKAVSACMLVFDVLWDKSLGF